MQSADGQHLYIGNLILLILNLPLVGLWVRLLLIPPPWLYAGILVIALLLLMSPWLLRA